MKCFVSKFLLPSINTQYLKMIKLPIKSFGREEVFTNNDFKSKIKEKFGGGSNKSKVKTKDDISYKTNFDHIQLDVKLPLILIEN